MEKLLRLLEGYVIVEIEGLGLEGFMSAAAASGVCFMDTVRISYSTMVSKIPAFSYFKLKRLSSRVRVRVIRFGGLPGAIIFARQRLALFIVLFAGLLALFICSHLCLGVEITGLSDISEFEVYSVLKENGWVPVQFKSGVDLDKLAIILRQRFPTLSYAHAQFDGVNLVVTLDEGTPVPETDSSIPGSIVASKAGVVTEVICREGSAVVQPGDIVSPGDVLIAGSYTKDETEFNVSAKGEVTAEVTYTASVTREYEDYELIPTGNTVEITRFVLGGKTLFTLGENPFELSEMTGSRDVIAGRGTFFPLHIIKDTYSEGTKTPTDKNLRDAISAATEEAYQKAMSLVPEEAIVKDFTTTCDNAGGRAAVTLSLVVTEQIGIFQ